MPYDELVNRHLNELRDEIRKVMREKNLDNTRDASASLEVVLSSKLIGNDYIYFLDQGRKPGRFPPVDNIRDWVRSKLGISNDSAVNSIAFLVGRKLKEEGSRIYKNKTLGLELDDLIEKMLDNLLEETPDFAAKEALKFIYEGKPSSKIVIS